MKLLSVKHVRRPRGNNKAYVYQRKVPKHLQKYDRGRDNKPRKVIEEPLGTTEAEAVEAYPAVHAKIENKLKHYKALYRNGTTPVHRHELLKETIAKWHLDEVLLEGGEQELMDALAKRGGLLSKWHVDTTTNPHTPHTNGNNYYYDHWFSSEYEDYLDFKKLGIEEKISPVTKQRFLECLEVDQWKKDLLEVVLEYPSIRCLTVWPSSNTM